MLEFNIEHRRSDAVLCMLFNIRYNSMHPLCNALPVSFVPVRVTRGAWALIGILLHLLTAESRKDFYSPLSIYVEQSW